MTQYDELWDFCFLFLFDLFQGLGFVYFPEQKKKFLHWKFYSQMWTKLQIVDLLSFIKEIF